MWTGIPPFNYTGAGQASTFLLPKIVAHFKAKAAVLELGNLQVIRDFSDVRCIAQAYCKLLQGKFAGEVLNVCSGQGHSLMEVLDMMKRLTGHEPEIRVNPAFLRTNEVHRLVGDGAKLTRLIGPIPSIPLQGTLKWMLGEGGV